MSEVSIIIVSYNTKELTRNCLKSVFEKTRDVNFDVIVVDNNSSDGSIEMIEEEFPQVRLIKNTENKGFGAANNIAIRQSSAKYIFLLNPDTLLVNNAVKIMFDYMEKNTEIGACGGCLYDCNMIPIHCGGHFPSVLEIFFKYGLKNVFKNFYNKHLIDDIGDKSKCKQVDQIMGADLFIRKQVLDDVGLFDENYFMYLEETDLQYRITQAGYKIMFIPDSKIIHLEGQSNKNDYSKRQMFKKSQMYYFRKHKGLLAVFIVKILYTGLYFIEFLIKRNIDSLNIIKYIWSET